MVVAVTLDVTPGGFHNSLCTLPRRRSDMEGDNCCCGLCCGELTGDMCPESMNRIIRLIHRYQ